jgi:hypothetical protein
MAMTVHEPVERRRKDFIRSWWDRAGGLTAPLRRNLTKQRDLILPQALAIQGMMQILMKPRNTGLPWTSEEVRQIRRHLWTLARFVPTLVVFLLPGGLLLLPILAEVLDRRQTPRE